MQLFIRVIGVAIFAAILGLSSTVGASAKSAVNPGQTLAEFDQTLPVELLNEIHAVIRAVPVRF